MGRLHAAVDIDAPPELAFEVFVDPARLARWFPGARGVDRLSGPLDRPGTVYTLVFRRPVRADCEVIAVDGQRLHERTFARRPLGVSGRARMTFTATATGTRVELDGCYEPPLGALGRLVDRLLARAGDRQARTELKAFKACVEGAATRRSE
jgi:uncharacterized protein YndB with AHSA1/START domain